MTNTAVDQQVARVSRRIRRWREEEHLTLQELAERGGLATSTVQKVETGQMMPSLAVLLKMARGLGRQIGELLEDEEETVEIFHSRAGERSSDAGCLVAERLSGNLVRSALEIWQVTLEPGASSGSDPIQYDGEEIVLCQQGHVTFRIGDEDYELQSGDSLHFRASTPHSWLNRGLGTARFTITGTLPALFRQVMQSCIACAELRVDRRPEPISLAG